mmetsp:Transcript_11645/g.19697  ORF Transcript_11645/g.19697 Transcript_11645/m.19697 type:complete len:223 (+) Transcript_11645:120-788(+)
MKSRTRTSLREDLADLYDDFAIGWNELFDEEPAVASRPSSRQQGIVPGPPLDPVPKGRARKALVPPYLRIGGKRSMLERAMKERLLECPKPRRKERTRDSQSSQGLQGEERPENTLQPFPRLRKPAEVVEVELDQLRVQLQKEIRERRRDARRRRQMRRRCRLQEGEDLSELEAHWKLERLEILSPRSDSQKLSARSFFSQLGQKRLQNSALCAPSAPLTAR